MTFEKLGGDAKAPLHAEFNIQHEHVGKQVNIKPTTDFPHVLSRF